MATRARIGLQQNKQIITSYQHWDGYPGGLGYKLIEHWEDPDKVSRAIKLGDASQWGQFIGEKIDFDNRQTETYYYQNVYYMRDRGEKDCKYRVFKDENDYLKNGFRAGEEYIYLMKDAGDKDYLGRPIGTWYYSHYDNPQWKPLMIDAVKEHINILKRSYKLEQIA